MTSSPPLEKLLRTEQASKSILLSGGGSEIAESEFALLLKDAASSLPPINEDIVTGVVNKRLRDACATIISGLTTITSHYLTRPIPFIIHRYDYPAPDGRGVLGGFWFLPEPWLLPGFRQKGYDDLAQNTGNVKTLIDRFNRMLKGLGAAPEFEHVHYLDLRGTLPTKPYKNIGPMSFIPQARDFVR